MDFTFDLQTKLRYYYKGKELVGAVQQRENFNQNVKIKPHLTLVIFSEEIKIQ